jgi:hypothetical protein
LPSITITISDTARLDVAIVATDGDRPAIGRTLTPAQALAMELLQLCNRYAHEVRYGAEHVPLLALAQELCNPEGLGFACTAEVRDRARRARGLQPVVTRRAA